MVFRTKGGHRDTFNFRAYGDATYRTAFDSLIVRNVGQPHGMSADVRRLGRAVYTVGSLNSSYRKTQKIMAIMSQNAKDFGH